MTGLLLYLVFIFYEIKYSILITRKLLTLFLLYSVLNKQNLTYSVQLVTKPTCKFDCHDGEVNAVKFHKNGKFFATGGGDRKIKLWEYKDSKTECFGALIGSNASIASIDIDNEVS
jgi:WD40 repeat protein